MSVDGFAQTYGEAREQFLARAALTGAEIDSETHPLLGRNGETLAIDAAWLGPPDAQSLLVVASGCHGVEGFCGSGVQNALLAHATLAAAAHAHGVALLLLHALNPHGFSWWRRTTHENVDLNRNFVDFTRPPPDAGYAALAQHIVPERWPPTEADTRELYAQVAAVGGERALQAIVAGGQYTHPDGLFYGGREPCWSQLALRDLLKRHGRRCKRIALVDLHSGLGAPGHCQAIFTGPADSMPRARSWWPALTRCDDGTSVSTHVEGDWWRAVVEECPQAEFTGAVLEFGTVPLLQVFDALRADQWAENHADSVDPALRSRIRRQMRHAFYVDDDRWRQQVVDQGLKFVRAAVGGLAQGRP